MQNRVENISEQRQRIHVELTASEVLSATEEFISLHGKEYGIEKSKTGGAESNIIKECFAAERVNYLARFILDNSIEEISTTYQKRPVGNFNIEMSTLEFNKNWQFSFEFEYLPKLDLENIQDLLEVNVDEPIPSKKLFADYILYLRRKQGTLNEVKIERNPKKGDILLLDIEARYQDKVLSALSRKNVRYFYGEQEYPPLPNEILNALPHTSIKGEVVCSEPYFDDALHGKLISVDIFLHKIYEENLPEFNDELAKKMGYKDIKKLKDSIFQDLMSKQIQEIKEKAEKELVDKLIEKYTFPCSETLLKTINNESQIMTKQALLRQNISESEINMYCKAKEEVTKESNIFEAKKWTFLLIVAREYKLSINESQLETKIKQLATSSMQDFEELKQKIYNSNARYELEDRILAEKAIEHLYKAAKKNIIKVKAKEES